MDLKPPIKNHGMWQFNNTTDTFTSPTGFCERPHEWDTTIYSNKRPIPLPDTPTPYPLPPETQKVSSSGNQRVPLLGKQRVSEESRTDFSFIPNASDLQTNNGHISKWDQARESELAYKNSNVKIYPILLPRYIIRRSRQRHTRAISQRTAIQFDGLEHHSTMPDTWKQY